MAPEQATGRGRQAGPAADIHALGAILYELLTGLPPFRASTTLETLERVRSTEAVPPGRLQPKLPRDVETICLKCLEKDPRKRFATAEDLADELGRFLEGRPIRSRPVGPATRSLRWCRRNKAVAAAGGLAALALLAVLVVSVTFGIYSGASAESVGAIQGLGSARARQEGLPSRLHLRSAPLT